MQNRIVKSCQPRKNRRAERLKELLSLKQSDSILLDACARKSPQDVYELMEALPDLNPDTIRDKYLRTPLHIACSRRDHLNAIRIANLLVKKGSDVMNQVGDRDGLLPMHMAVLAGNDQCVLMLLSKGANIPASNPFRLTSLLLVKLKLDNLRQSQYMINNHHMQQDDDDSEDDNINYDDYLDWLISDSAKSEYQDLISITKVLVTHLANSYIKLYGLPLHDDNTSNGISDYLFDPVTTTIIEQRSILGDELNDAISSITHHLAAMEMNEAEQVIQDSMNDLIEKVKQLGVNEVVN
ncbi:hypothetical protein K501DRAFT_232143 [Backusella circina FSU 941]|nr:hypothetical protein K501DRAFT_232143 [Backusella circina FSU 941]